MTLQPCLLTALVHADSARAAQVMRAVAQRVEAAGRSLAGVLEHALPRPGRTRCDMILEELSQGARIAISQDRGPLARGCRLDAHEMARAIALVSDTLRERPQLLMLNKFGKAEAEGGGFRPLIAAALEQGVPVLIAVPLRNLDAWRNFAGGLGQEIGLDDADAWLDGLCPRMPAAEGPHP
ncbi:DUF2478 domain-containing protein [Roseococcus sp. SDR]|uniref:DUF2478 domain-containing protein n=1 Tax=Roseococcus sp. SDR TaxID=2835532 RepID=UPI001BCB3198|nr:DUF2478 domain-containing protein [Roseococcus sp. SDR]MBS7792680.1 DUF2478 domain-containing protein [Roseococcus sp. SDR]MBV1847994.1 DUF2478 domain-containing protein [Roseococcus sp. SDR]